MALVFDLPDVGEGITEGELVSWLVEEGDHVEEDDPIVEVMTDKATVEIPSPRSGVILKRYNEEGDMVKVESPLVVIGEEGEDWEEGEAERKQTVKERQTAEKQAEKKEKEEEETQPEPATKTASADGNGKPAPEPSEGRTLATPATRRLAREKNVNLDNVEGTGKAGRVLKEDVLKYAETDGEAAVAEPETTAEPVPTTQEVEGEEPVESVPFRGVRKVISEAMSTSKDNAAHFTVVDEADMTRLVEIRNDLKEKAQEQNIKLTYLPFIFKALVPALKEFPRLNSSLDEESQEIKVKKYYHFGFACDTDEGLKVPVVNHVDQKSIFQLAREINDKAQRARDGDLSTDELQGSTFTVTSAGNIGGLFATPIINYPESAIMGIHEIKDRPVARDGEVVIRKMMYLSLSLDHRIVDGADGVRFSNRVIEFFEKPHHLLAEI